MAERPEHAAETGVSTVMVVGAGTMGRGIAQVAAEAGFSTILYDADAGALERGLAAVHDAWRRLIDRGKRDAAQVAAFTERLRTADAIDAASGADLAIEAIFENPVAKIALFKELDARCPPVALLASNTSSISITRLAAATGRPERFVGMHFFNPAPVMPLVEIVRGLRTSDASAERAAAVARAFGKTPVVVHDAPGFVVNRVLLPMINEAVFAFSEGVAGKEAIDEAMKLGAAHPMGPLALADLIGLDVCLDILQTLHRDLGEDKYRPAPLLERMVDAGLLGRKSGEGFYRYDG